MDYRLQFAGNAYGVLIDTEINKNTYAEIGKNMGLRLLAPSRYIFTR